MRELSFGLVTVRALCSGAWAHYPQDLCSPRSSTLNDTEQHGNLECAGTGDRAGNSRDPSCEKITRDRMENGHGPDLKRSDHAQRGLATVAVSSLVFPDLHPFLRPCQS